MNIPKERVAWTVAAIATLVIGLSIGKNRERSRIEKEQAAAESSGKTSRRERGRDDETAASHRAPNPKDTDAVRRRTRLALTSASLHERAIGMDLVRDSLTRENWETVWKEHVRQTLEDGRTHNFEWSRTMRRIGEVAGAEAMEFFETNGEPQKTGNRGAVLVGWASADPEAALAWMQNQPEDSPNQRLWRNYLEGMSEGDPMFAIEHREELPENIRGQALNMAADGLIQNRNLTSAYDTLNELVQDLPADSPPPGEFVGFYFALKNRIGFIEDLGTSYPEFDTRVPDMSELDARFEQTISDMRPPQQRQRIPDRLRPAPTPR